MKKSFAELFKRYRLRAEFEKLSHFGEAFAEKGVSYEDSIFSHWQKGTRIPTDRKYLLKLLELFIERKAITSIDEANELIESTGQGFLTTNEIALLPSLVKDTSIFQVPNDILNFAGREKLIHSII